ncbi:hypothetical protein EP7_000078 [Isosphaeraceae bacterium EP7]
MRDATRQLKRISCVAAAALALAWSGCGGGAADFAPETKYTPETIAQELVFRYRALGEGDQKLTAAAGRGKNSRARSKERNAEKVQAKSKEATKAAPVRTADSLLDEIASKVRSLPDAPAADSFKKVAAAVRADTTLTPAGRDNLAGRLDELAAESR